MSDANDPIGPDEYRKRIADICARGGRHYLPRRARDRWILLFALRRALDAREPLSEKVVDARIQSWLLQTGRALEIDHVALRRALVDEGFLTREPHGAAYRASAEYRSRVAFDAAVDAIDPEAIVADALAQAVERRRINSEREGEDDLPR